MKTIKPSAVSLLTRTFEFRGRCYFAVTPMLFVSLTGNLRLRNDISLWQFVAAEMGEGAAIDPGMPKATPEYLIHGRAFAPERKPIATCAVRARFAAREKLLFVLGDRQWQGRIASDPLPFAEMPLDWTHAFGGEGSAANPSGKGTAQVETSDPAAWPLPNIEYPDDRLLHPGQAVKPAGFGARDASHPERIALAGTYDDKWLKNDFPGLPRDADWKYFNAAAPDQWLNEPMSGTESWQFENMHPSVRILHGELPGVRTRCFIVRRIGNQERFEEISTRFDTVWFFPHRECAILIARGLTEVSEEDAGELKALVTAAEWNAETRPASHYQEALRKRLDPESGHFFMLKEDDLLPSGIGERYAVEQLVSGPIAAPRPLLADNLQKRQLAEIEQARAMVATYGLDPDAGHAPKLPEAGECLPEKLEDLPAYLDRIRAQADESKVIAEAKEKQFDSERRALFTRLGMDYSVIEREVSQKPKGPPSLSAKAELNKLSQLRQSLLEQGGPAKEIDRYLEDPAFRQRLVEGEQKAKECYRLTAHLQEPAEPMPGQRAQWIKQRAAEHFQSGNSFAGIDLTGADLSNMSLPGADFSGAMLEGVDFSNCNLTNCNFDKAVLARANLGGADLRGATLRDANLGEALCEGTVFDGANLEGAILGGARLARARFGGANLQRANLTGGARFEETDWSGADASDVVFIDADLKGLKCSGTNLERAVFVRCDMERVDFSGARFDRASFINAKGTGACFRDSIIKRSVFVGGAEFGAADFSGAEISSTNFRPSNLAGARFDRARIREADLSQCQLQESSFVMATALDTRFGKADLSRARFMSANLMNSSLQRAKMEGTDFRHANLFAADLARVSVDGATNFADALTGRVRIYPRLAPPAGPEAEGTG